MDIDFRCARRELVVLYFAAYAALWSVPAKGADWEHWRGPTRNSVSAEPSGWDGETWLKGELWRASVGEGSSSPLVVGSHVYLTGWSNNHDTLHCLDAKSGKEVWRQTYKTPRYGRFAEGDQFLYSGPCSTPDYDSRTGLLCTLSADGDLIAWDTNKDGQRVWALNLYERYQVPRRPEVAKRRKTQRDYGYTSSSLAIDGQLIVEVGGTNGNLVAFDILDTGVELWTGGKVGSQGSCIVTSDERLIVYANNGVLSLVDSAKRSPKKYAELAAQIVLSKTDAWPHVVLAGSRLYCRDRDGSVRCLAVSSKLATDAN